MKVLHFYKSYFPDTVGGIEQVINEIINSTSKLGVEAEVLSLTSKKDDRTVMVDGHLSHRSRSNFEIASTPFSISVFAKFKKLAKKTDIIHYHFPWPVMDAAHFACRIKKPTLLTYHSDIIKQKYLLKLYQPLQKYFLSSVNRIVATSPNYLATSDVLQSLTDKIDIIPNGLNKEHYHKPDKGILSRWEKHFPEKFLLFIGVFRYYKGLHTLIEAAKTFEYPIVIVGSGPIESELKAKVKALGLQNIHFTGRIDMDDKVALLTLCHALVFPSDLRSEAFGVSLLEGAMFGKPMISTEIGTGTSYINIDKVTGLVVPPKNPDALRHAMQTLCDNPQEAAAMGKRAEQRYWNLFTAEKMGESYFKLYRELLQ